MANEGFDKASKNFEAMQVQAAKMLKTQVELEKGISGYAKVVRDIHKTQNDILHIEQQKIGAQKELAAYEKKTGAERLKLEADVKKLTGDELKIAEKRLAVILTEMSLKKGGVAVLERDVKLEKEKLETLKKAVGESNKLKAIANSTKNFVKKWGFDKLKEYGVFDMDKEIRKASQSMGISSKNAGAFSQNLEKAGASTVLMGVSTKKLAIMQKGYSEEIGRSVALSQKGLEAMADMSEGTGLGEQFAIGMAGAMDKFGGSVVTSRDLVQETVDMAGSMGVNSAKAAKSLSTNLKLAQKYKFKGGVKGLARMSTEALKLRLDLDGIASLADKVFRPEGAIEMAAKLQTMGGAFAQMANPMELMFKARNDFEGFAKDIGAATAEFVEYNKENGTFDIKGGLAADRMREIANMTGIGAEKLQEMAVAQAKMKMIGGVVPFSVNKEDEALISSMSTIGADGEIKIKVDGFSKDIKELKAVDMESLRGSKETLRKRAEDSRTAMETFDDIKTSFTQLLIPVAKALKDDFAVPLRNLVNNPKFMAKMRKLVTGIAELVGTVTKFIINNPIKSIIGGIGLALAGKAAMWMANGKFLRMGFNMGGGVPGMPGSGGGGTGGGGLAGMVGGKNTKLGRGMRNMKASRLRAGRGLGRSMARGGGAGMGMGVLAGGMSAYSEYQENKELGMGGKENIGRSATKGITAGLGAWGGAAAGAAIGSVVPVIGTVIGGLIGGALGAMGGDAIGDGLGNAMYGDKERNGLSLQNATRVNDGIIKFNPKDKFMQMNDGLLMASTAEGQLHKSAKELSGGGDVNHKFEKMDINFNINTSGSDAELIGRIINTPAMARQLNTSMNETAMRAMDGGKTSMG